VAMLDTQAGFFGVTNLTSQVTVTMMDLPKPTGIEVGNGYVAHINARAQEFACTISEFDLAAQYKSVEKLLLAHERSTPTENSQAVKDVYALAMAEAKKAQREREAKVSRASRLV
jgi:hypothetical protein